MCRICGCETHAHEHGRGHVHDHPHDHPHAHAPPWRTPPRVRSLEFDLLAKNDRLAAELRARFARDAITTLNLIGAPGAGKTTLLEQTIRHLAGEIPIAVLEGDQATDHDARRIAATGCPVVQINTDAGCHLDATMVDRGLASLTPGQGSILFVENVGNLVCPALFDVGESAKVVVMSVTEGEDKPLKYPHVFRAATALVLTKTDLLPHLELDAAACIANARRIQPALAVFPVAARRDEGLADWCGWLREQHGRLA